MRRAVPRTIELSADSPPIVCLCGSTRFKRQFIDATFRFTMRGHIVLSVGWFSHADKDVYFPTEEEKQAFDRLHLWKIRLADFVFVINPGGYIGESTTAEIVYAKDHGKPIYYLEHSEQDGQKPYPFA